MRKVTVVFIAFSTIFIISCAPRKLNPEAGQVKIADYSTNIARSCKFMGDIILESIHGDLKLSASQSERELDDINFLKNEGKKLEANVVALIRHDSRLVERKRGGKLHFLKNKPYTTYDIQAKGYRCPEGMGVMSIKNVSAVFPHVSATKDKNN